MLNEFSAKVYSKPVIDALNDIERRADRATMWALRETGRKTKQVAKRNAPVYKGDRGDTIHTREIKTARKKFGVKGQIAGTNQIIVGLLKDSIASSRKLKKVGESYTLRVGPFGPRVFLYAKKIEALKPYMQKAYDEVVPQMVEIHARSWARANERK